MYQGPMSKVLDVPAVGDQVIVFGPFDAGDEVSSVDIQSHSDGSAAAFMLVQIERRAGSAIPDSFGGGTLVTGAPLLIVSPIGIDSLIRIPVNFVFTQRETVVIDLVSSSGNDDNDGFVGIAFRGGVSRGRGGGSRSDGGGGVTT